VGIIDSNSKSSLNISQLVETNEKTKHSKSGKSISELSINRRKLIKIHHSLKNSNKIGK
jgi:hypothetical protein